MTFADVDNWDFGKPLHLWDIDARTHYYILRVAAEWQSPGSIGSELATLASRACVTAELPADISKTIRQARAGYGQSRESDVELSKGIADLKIMADALGLELDEDVR